MLHCNTRAGMISGMEEKMGTFSLVLPPKPLFPETTPVDATPEASKLI